MKQAVIPHSLLLLIISLACCAAAKGQVFDPNRALPADSSIIQGELENGLRYYILEHDEPRDRAEFRLVVKTGSLQEEADQLGIAHFVEHMAFNGTEHFAKNELIDFLELAGGSFGADLNASTSFSETIYQIQVPTDSIELLDKALLVLEDWAGGLLFDSLEVEKERGIVVSEWRSRLSAQERLRQQQWPVLLQNSRFAERLPIGDPILIDTVHRERLIDYYQQWYQPERMAVIAVGQFDPAWMKQEIVRRFGALESQRPPKSSPEYHLDSTARSSFVLATDPEYPFASWQIVHQLDYDPPQANMGALRQELRTNLYNSMLNARLAELKEQGIPSFTFAYSGYSSLSGHYQSYNINAFTTVDKIEASLITLMQETKRVADHGFIQAELDRQKAAILQNVQATVEEFDKIPSGSRAHILLRSYLNETPPISIPDLPTVYAEALATIELADINELATSWQGSRIRTSLLSVKETEAELMPDSARWHFLLDSLSQAPTTPYDQKQEFGSLLELDDPFASFREVSYDSVLDIRSFELSNRMRIHLKPTDFKNDEILLRMFSSGGKSLYEGNNLIAARHAINILNESGLDTFPASQLERLLAGKQASAGSYISEYTEGIGGRSNNEDLETMFQLVHLYFTSPRFDSLILATYREKQKEIFARIDDDPRSAWGRMLIDLKYDYHPHRPNLTLKEFDSIDLPHLRHVYQDRFRSAGDFDVVIVGNFDTDSILELSRKYLGSLPTYGSGSWDNWRDQGLRLQASNLDTVVIAGQTPKAEVNLEWHSAFRYEDTDERYHFTALRELLRTRLREKLREDLGGVYGVRLSASFRVRPDTFCFANLRFNCAPEFVDTLIAAVHEQIDLIAKGEVEEEELEKIRQGQLKTYEEALRQNGFWLNQITNRIDLDRSFTGLYPGKYEALVNSLSADRIAELARRYLQEAYYFRFILLPDLPPED